MPPHRLRIDGPTVSDGATILARSLTPEAADLEDDRSTTHVTIEDDRLVIDIEASDLVALRAAANTWMGLLRTAESVRTQAEAGY